MRVHEIDPEGSWLPKVKKPLQLVSLVPANISYDFYLLFLINFIFSVRNRGSIPGCVIPKTLKIVLDTSLLNTQQYKVRIKGKVEQSRERSSVLPYTSV